MSGPQTANARRPNSVRVHYIGWQVHWSMLNAGIVAANLACWMRRGQRRTTNSAERRLGAWTPRLWTWCGTSLVTSEGHEELGWCATDGPDAGQDAQPHSAHAGVEQWSTQAARQEQRCSSRYDSRPTTPLAILWSPDWPCQGAAATSEDDRNRWKRSGWRDASSSVRCRARPLDHDVSTVNGPTDR